MGWAVAVPAAASVVGGLLQNRAAGKASDASERATDKALAFEREKIAEQRRQWEARQARLAPFRMGGVGLLQKYYGPGFYQQSQEFSAPTPTYPGLQGEPRNLAQLALQRRMGIPVPESFGGPEDWEP